MSYQPIPTSTENAAILASALTSLTGNPVITQIDYMNQRLNGNSATFQNINPVALHNSYLSGGAVPTTTPQQNITTFQENGYVNQQYTLYYSNSQVISHHNCSANYNQIPYLPIPNNPIIPQQVPQQVSAPQIQPQPQIIITINISTLNGQVIPISNVPVITKVFAIKSHIERKTRIPTSIQRLVYSGMALRDDKTLSDYNISNDNLTIYLIGQISSSPNNSGVISFIDSNFLDPMYDCDFTNIRDDKKFMRGPYEYRRPCGWKRIAVKVLNKYGPDNAWLGTAAKKGSWRYESLPMEWPVSYHGTNKCNAKSIAETGFDISKGKRFKFGHGIYSTPDINIAMHYASKFIHNNEVYCLVFQNRINPNTLVKIETDIGEYWISPNSDDIRPYGICIKKLGKIP